MNSLASIKLGGASRGSCLPWAASPWDSVLWLVIVSSASNDGVICFVVFSLESLLKLKLFYFHSGELSYKFSGARPSNYMEQ